MREKQRAFVASTTCLSPCCTCDEQPYTTHLRAEYCCPHHISFNSYCNIWYPYKILITCICTIPWQCLYTRAKNTEKKRNCADTVLGRPNFKGNTVWNVNTPPSRPLGESKRWKRILICKRFSWEKLTHDVKLYLASCNRHFIIAMIIS